MNVESGTVAHRNPLFAIGKAVANGLALFAVLPSLVTYRLFAMLMPARRVEAFQARSQLLSLVPGKPGIYMRRAFYRRTLASCSSTCSIGFGTILSTPEARIGEHVYIGARCMLGLTTIGDDTLLGSNVDIMSGRNQHHIDRLDIPIRLQGGTLTRVTVGRDSWIGNGARILADVGDQSVVAAGSVVVKPVTDRTIVGGNPARILGSRTASLADRPREGESVS